MRAALLPILLIACSSKTDKPRRDGAPPVTAAATEKTESPVAIDAIDANTATPAAKNPTVEVTPDLLARLRGCTAGGEPAIAAADLPPVKVERIGARPAAEALHVHGKKRRYYVVFKPTCVVYPIAGRPLAYAKASFAPGGTQTAYILEGSCDDDPCPPGISIKDGDTLVDMIAGPVCSGDASASRLRAFASVDTLRLDCSGAYRTSHLVHLVDGRLEILGSFEMGIIMPMSDSELDEGMCDLDGVGDIGVGRRGDAPVLKIARAISGDDDAIGDELCKRPALAAEWTYDPIQRRLIKGAETRIIRDACDCTRRDRRKRGR
jgi:hypothetical protein